jgi:hypothetical protein
MIAMKHQEPTRPSGATVKRLFARSGNRCAYPKCTVEIIHEESIVGEICHIKAASPNGPRYDPHQSAADRHGYDNLLLLCANHHTVIDDDPEAYTVERLIKMKADHEGRSIGLAADQIDRGTRLLVDQSVIATNQSGGIIAHTVHQTINLHPPGAQTNPAAQRRALIDAARKFHRERVERIAKATAPVALLNGGALVMHVVPLAATDDQQTPSFDAISTNPNRFPPIVDNHARNAKITYDGLLTASNGDGFGRPQRAYVQVFRSGAVEAVASSLARGREHNFLQLPNIQAMIIKYAGLYASALSAFGVEPPFAVLVSLVGVAGMRLLQDFIGNALPEDLPFDALDRERLSFGDIVFDSTPADYRAAAKLVKPILDHLANAAGLTSSPYFDADGNYLLKL